MVLKRNIVEGLAVGLKKMAMSRLELAAKRKHSEHRKQVAVKVERGWAEPSVDEQQRELEERESWEEALSREMDDWFRSRREEATEKPEDLLKMQAQRLKDQAQRLKEENMALLREQNLKLMKEVEKLKSQSHGAGEGGQSSGSEWSTVSPPVPRAMSPKRIVRTLSPSGLKMTPGGTRVPSCSTTTRQSGVGLVSDATMATTTATVL